MFIITYIRNILIFFMHQLTGQQFLSAPYLRRVTKTFPAHAPALHIVTAVSRPPVNGPMYSPCNHQPYPPPVQRRPQLPTQRQPGRRRVVGAAYLAGRPDRAAWHERLFYGDLPVFGFQLHRYGAGRLPGDQWPFAERRH